MTFEFKEHEADMGIVGIGSTLEESFEEAAKAMFEIMTDISRVKDKEKVKLEVNSNSLDKLLIEFLNELLFLKDSKAMLFSLFAVNIHRHKDENGVIQYKLKARIFGEPTDTQKHFLKTEVKAATYSGLKVYELAGKFYAECVVDV